MKLKELIAILQTLDPEKAIYYHIGNIAWPFCDVHEGDLGGNKVVLVEWTKRKE